MIDRTQIERLRIQALRDGDKEVKSLLDYILGQVQTKEKDTPDKGDPTVAIIKAYIKSTKEMLQVAHEVVRDEYRDKALREIEYLEALLPATISVEQLKKDISELKSSGGNMGSIMKELKSRYGDALDGKLASNLVKAE